MTSPIGSRAQDQKEKNLDTGRSHFKSQQLKNNLRSLLQQALQSAYDDAFYNGISYALLAFIKKATTTTPDDVRLLADHRTFCNLSYHAAPQVRASSPLGPPSKSMKNEM
jgi:hypothetical protein